MAIEIVDLPNKNGDFHSYVNVYCFQFSQRIPTFMYCEFLLSIIPIDCGLSRRFHHSMRMGLAHDFRLKHIISPNHTIIFIYQPQFYPYDFTVWTASNIREFDGLSQPFTTHGPSFPQRHSLRTHIRGTRRGAIKKAFWRQFLRMDLPSQPGEKSGYTLLGGSSHLVSGL